MKWRILLLIILASALVFTCDDGGGDGDGDVDSDVDGDSDSDVDVDVDVDVDSDIDSDSDGDTDDDGDTDTDEDFDPLDGFGVITGACGVLDAAEWDSTEPFLFVNQIDFGEAEFDPSLLSAGAQEILADGTAGGSSGNSEALSYDLLYRCELAELLLTETEVVYTDPESSLTDFLAAIDEQNIGVSVTRAFHFPPEEPCVQADLADLLDRKLDDVLEAEANAAEANPWTRSILHVIAYNEQCAEAAQAAWDTLDAETRADTIVVITVTEGADEFLY